MIKSNKNLPVHLPGPVIFALQLLIRNSYSVYPRTRKKTDLEIFNIVDFEVCKISPLFKQRSQSKGLKLQFLKSERETINSRYLAYFSNYCELHCVRKTL